MSNYPWVPIFEVVNTLFHKLLHLLQNMLFCSILQQTNNFWESNPPESIRNVKLPLYTNFGSIQCIILQVITFAANYAILQHFAAN